MLLVDMGSISGDAIGVYSTKNNMEDDERLSIFRVIAMQHLTMVQRAYTPKYGNIILAFDSKPYWREDVFEFYKQNRIKHRAKSTTDWKLYGKHHKIVNREIIEYTKYIPMKVDNAEADDIIFVLSKLASGKQPIMVISSDKDMIQLQQKYEDVSQWSPGKKSAIIDDGYSLLTHILKGDSSDGIPNIFSPSDILMFPGEGRRQKVMTKKILTEAHSLDNIMEWGMLDDESMAKLKRNETLISAEGIPEYMHDRIVDTFKVEAKRRRTSRLRAYFIKHKMRKLL